ncbi:GIN domain-containing protein [Bacteroidota bacterium]
MKKSIIVLLAVLTAGFATKIRAEDQKQLEPFHSIIVSSEIEAELILSKNEAIEMDFENASPEDMIIEIADSVLKVRMKTGNYKDASLKVRIHYNKDLRMLEAGGRAIIWSEEDLYFEKDLAVKLFNGGEMRLRLNCDSLNASLTQGSVIHLEGKTRALTLKVNTGATFSGYKFESMTADVNAIGGGKAKISVRQSLKANASAKGFIGYIGEPTKLDKKTSLKGEIIKTFLEE